MTLTDARTVMLLAATVGVALIFDNAGRSELTSASQTVPLKIVWLDDCSVSVGGGLFQVRSRRKTEMIQAVSRRLRSADGMTVGTFCTDIRIAPGWWRSTQELSRAVDQVVQPAGAPSPIWDAVHRAVERLSQETAKRAVFLVSDGKSSGNLLGFEEAAGLATRRSVIVFATQVVGSGSRQPRPGDAAEYLLRLAELTGGKYAETRWLQTGDFFGSAVTALVAGSPGAFR